MKYNIFFFVLFSLSSFASGPNMEGLFRNLSSGDATGNVQILKLRMVPLEIDGQKENSEESKYIKMVFSIEDSQVDLFQLEYKNANFSDSEVVRVRHFPSLNKVVMSDGNIERSIFYGLLSMFATNLSKPLVFVLRKLDPDFLLNSNILNEEQVRIYSKQRRHLVSVRSGATQASAPSPLRPATDDEKKKISETMNQDMYKKSENVNLVRENNNFYWQIKLSKIEALFSNKDFSILKLKIMQKESNYEYSFANYTMMSGESFLPQKIIYKNPNDKLFETQIFSFESVTATKQKIVERYKSLEEKSAKQKATANNSAMGLLY